VTVAAATIIDACADGELFGRWFRTSESWQSWFAFLRALFGLPLGEADVATFRACTGREAPAQVGYREAWLVVGRRGGKSLVLATVAAFLACFVDWTPYLAPGERGTIMVIAADRRQARTIYRYVRSMLRVPLLAPFVQRENDEAIDLSNAISIEIAVASYKSVRGYTVIAALCDELAFWRTDEGSTNPDVEIISALRPAMATVPGAVLLCASSPYARRGALWDAFRRHFGKPSPVLVWKAPTRVMNCTVPQEVIDEAMEADAPRALAEYGAEFRTDVETFVSREVVEAAVAPGRHELSRVKGVAYVGFVDPSGGSADSMTIAVAHRDASGRAVLDAVRERRPPFSPEAVVEEFAVLVRSYGIARVTGDRYAGEWPRERFNAHGILYIAADKPKSDLYRDLLRALNSGRVELLDVPRLVGQLCGLERRTARGGRDTVDHPPGGRDDVANAVAGAVGLAIARKNVVIAGPMIFRNGVLDPCSADVWSDYTRTTYGDREVRHG
jgi:hypothetical protein